MNFTIIRNWVGQVGGDVFYEACDRHGVMVWPDFWLANPWDGFDPPTMTCSSRTRGT
jgi:beta-galactosidase/beta-glucuronidase